MNQTEVKGHEYRIGTLDAFKKLHLSRKVAPLIPALIPIFAKYMAEGNGMKSDLGSLPEIIKPITDGISNMSFEDSEYILGTCLQAVHRRAGDTWAQIWNSNGNVCMFSDIDLDDMLVLTHKVLMANLGPFISGLLTSHSIDSSVSQASSGELSQTVKIG